MSRKAFSYTIKSWSLRLGHLALACLLGTACWHDSSAESAPRPVRNYIVGVSPFIPQAQAAAVRKALFLMMLEKIPIGSHVTVFDAYHLVRITDFAIPAKDAFTYPKIRTKQFAPNLRETQRFLDTSVVGDGEAGEGMIRVPEFLDLVASLGLHDQPPATVVLLGGALYLDPNDARFSMAGGLYPTDEHLCVARAMSVFGTTDRRGQLRGARVHYAYLGHPWVNAVHEEPVRRFWSLFIEEQGGELVTFVGDLPTVVDRMADPDAHAPWRYQLNCTEPPNPSRPLRIGIRWTCHDCDLDLYSRPGAAAAELCFRNTRTPEGVYIKDYTSSPPANDFEWIEYRVRVDLSKVKAAVNFYAGQSAGGVSGEVRVQSGERTYGAPFRIAASEGNQGGESDHRASSRYWTVLDIGALVGRGRGRPAQPGISAQPRPAPAPVAAPPTEPPAAAPPSAASASRGVGAARGVRILSPQNGSTIHAGQTPSPVPHAVEGDVYGFGQGEIERFHLEVEVSILTNDVFPQGIAEVHGNGTWRLPTAWFGGSQHTVRAVLKDGNGNEINSQEISVTVVH